MATYLGAWSAVTWRRHFTPSNRAVRLADHAPGLRQDAHFVTKEGGGALGVSDGVSSWAEVGVDAAEYSRQVGPPRLPDLVRQMLKPGIPAWLAVLPGWH